MQNGVPDAADVLINSAITEPVLRDFSVEGSAVIASVGISIEVPRRIDKRVHRVGFASSGTATLWANSIDELGNPAERRSTGQRDLDIFGQDHRQIVFRYGDNAVLLAIEHWDRSAPVALARDSPVLQAIRDRCFA